ncbi:MAG: hypothetical protein AAGA58_18180 [Verrucomicrobiota bacterium]
MTTIPYPAPYSLLHLLPGSKGRFSRSDEFIAPIKLFFVPERRLNVFF